MVVHRESALHRVHSFGVWCKKEVPVALLTNRATHVFHLDHTIGILRLAHQRHTELRLEVHVTFLVPLLPTRIFGWGLVASRIRRHQEFRAVGSRVHVPLRLGVRRCALDCKTTVLTTLLRIVGFDG